MVAAHVVCFLVFVLKLPFRIERFDAIYCPKYVENFGQNELANVRNLLHISDMNNHLSTRSLRDEVLLRISRHPNGVWTPGDFVDLAGRDAIDKTLQRLAKSGDLRRIERGLYDLPSFNSLTSRQTVPDYRAVIEAVARRDQARFVIDGMTAANELGLTTAVPARIRSLARCTSQTHLAGHAKDRFQTRRAEQALLGRPACNGHRAGIALAAGRYEKPRGAGQG